MQAYLSIIQTIADALAVSNNNWDNAGKSGGLEKMHTNLTKIINDL